MTSCQISLAAMQVFQSYYSYCFSFVSLNFKCGRALKESSLKVATTRAELHKIQHKSIQVVAEGSGLKNYFIRNVAAFCNLHTMFVREMLKTLCCLSNWIQQSIQKKDSSGERIAKLLRSTRKLQSLILVSILVSSLLILCKIFQCSS